MKAGAVTIQQRNIQPSANEIYKAASAIVGTAEVEYQ